MAQGSPPQEEGLATVTVLIHVPFTAIIETLVPTDIPVTLFPEIVPEVVWIVAPVVSLKLNSHEVPLQTAFPTIN